MPLYYFDVHDYDVTRDPEGADFADDEAAIANAVIEARVLAAETVREGHFIGHHRIDITNGKRKPIGSVRFDEAVTVSE
jgi:hypothetical protein